MNTRDRLLKLCDGLEVAGLLLELAKANPHHDESGRFTSAEGGAKGNVARTLKRADAHASNSEHHKVISSLHHDASEHFYNAAVHQSFGRHEQAQKSFAAGQRFENAAKAAPHGEEYLSRYGKY